MSNHTDTNQASEDELQRELERLYKCVVYDLIDDVDRKEVWIKEVGIVVKALLRNEKLKLLAEVRERVVGEDEKLVIPDYPKTDDEGEPLYSKRAAKEGRKQVTARYHTRKELRNDQRTELTQLEAEL